MRPRNKSSSETTELKSNKSENVNLLREIDFDKMPGSATQLGENNLRQ